MSAEEGEPETIFDPIEPLSPEIQEKLCEHGIEMPDWKPKIPHRNVALVCDVCGKPPFWGMPRVGDPCPDDDGHLVPGR